MATPQTPQDYLRQAGIKLALLKECIVHEWGDVWYFRDGTTNRIGKIRHTLQTENIHGGPDIPEKWTLYWMDEPINDPLQDTEESRL